MNNTNTRAELIAQLLALGIPDWATARYLMQQAADMLEADTQDFETYSGIIKSSTARERHTRETLRKLLANMQAQQVAVPMSDSEIGTLREKTFSTDNPYRPVDSKSMRKAVRATESHYGIVSK